MLDGWPIYRLVSKDLHPYKADPRRKTCLNTHEIIWNQVAAITSWTQANEPPVGGQRVKLL